MAANGVPAEVCDNCGEAYVDGRISSELLKSGERMIAAGGQVWRSASMWRPKGQSWSGRKGRSIKEKRHGSG